MKTYPFKPLLIVATLIALAGVTHAEEAKDPFKKTDARPAPRAAVSAAAEAEAEDVEAMFVSVHEETFSLPIADVFALLRKSSSDADRYSELVRRTEAGQARIERLIVLRTISGQQAKTESVDEFIYPTEYGFSKPAPAPQGNQPGAKPSAPAQPPPGVSVPVPGGFQTRNVGDTLNLTPQIGPDGRTINVTLIPEVSRFAGYKGPGDEKWSLQPLFEAQRITTSVVVKDGEPFLLGTLNPPFNNGVAAEQKEQRVWLDFLTVHILPERKKVSAYTQRAMQMAVPEIQFRDAAVADAVAFLTAKSQELDPNKRGLNFVLRVPPSKTQTKITLSLRNVPLLEAARYIAKAVGLQLTVQENAVVLHPEGEKP